MMLKKDSLIKGTLILAAAALVARFLGLFQRIPLDYMLTDEGVGIFNLANQIYLLLLLVATAGFPSAISKMVSQRYALGKLKEAKRIYKASLVFGSISGFILASLLFLCAPYFTENIAHVPNADLSLRAIAPALLLFPIIAMMRGYFQGRQMMSAGGLSQIVEQFVRVILGIGLGILVLSLGFSERVGVATITFGSVFGSLGAFAVMLSYVRKLRKQDDEQTKKDEAEVKIDSSEHLRFRTIYKEIFRMSLPAVVTSTVINVIFTFDLTFFMQLTESYYTKAAASVMYADLGISQSLAGIPPILAIALGSSIIPVISSAFSLNHLKEVQKQSSAVFRIVCFSGVPFALYMTVSAFSIKGLLFESTSGYGIVAALAASTIVQITMMTSNSILYGLEKQRISMRHTLVGLLAKIVISIAIAPVIGVYGLVVGSVVCFVLVTILNLRSINQIVKLHILGKRWTGYLIAVSTASLVGWGAERGVLAITEGWIAKLSYLVAASSAGVAVGIVYLALLVLLRVITSEDVNALPTRLQKPFMRVIGMLSRKQISK